MAASEQRVAVIRGSQQQEVFREWVDEYDSPAMRRILHNWLESNGIDRALWQQQDWKITALNAVKLVEVRA